MKHIMIHFSPFCNQNVAFSGTYFKKINTFSQSIDPAVSLMIGLFKNFHKESNVTKVENRAG
jgi:hypothetical protein